MNERNMTVNISGKQINIAKDNATIRAIQNNKIEEKELDVAIKAIVDNLLTLNEENTYKILNILILMKKIFLKFKWEIKRCDNKMTIFFRKNM